MNNNELNNINEDEQNVSANQNPQQNEESFNQSIFDMIWTALFLRGGMSPPFGGTRLNQLINRRNQSSENNSQEIENSNPVNTQAQDSEQDNNNDQDSSPEISFQIAEHSNNELNDHTDDDNNDYGKIDEHLDQQDAEELYQNNVQSEDPFYDENPLDSLANYFDTPERDPDREPSSSDNVQTDSSSDVPQPTPPRTRTIFMVYQTIPSRTGNSGEESSAQSPILGRPRHVMRIMFVMDSATPQEDDGLDSILNRLMELHQPPKAPPTSQTFIDTLPQRDIDDDNKMECPSCTVCFDEFEVGSSASYLPCKHQFHKDCITPWLSEHNTCPVCRFSLPTEPESAEAAC
eukprot:TRINITY_DN13437_c0_g1_i1.p1 TRINITY_DN13437_c0_g1~~TRINITY_DN13437_c0_g1_i1.p1  ORF type:complete len:360 (-),score=65.88 TRINITY_DN13437_c0_g1_i1:160-1200(-)